LEFLKIPPSYFEKQPNFSLPCHPRKIHLSQSPKKTSFRKRWNRPFPPLLTQKNPFGKEKKRFLTFHPLVLKLHL